MTIIQNNTPTYKKYLNYLQYASISILAIVAIYLVYCSWNWKYALDVPPIRYVAKRILAGELPYKDVFEFNMPFTYLVHLIILLFSESDLAVRIADLVFQFIGMWGIFRIMQPINKKAGLVASLLFLCFNIIHGGPSAMLQRDLMIACLMPHIVYVFIYADKVKNYHFIISIIICLCAILIKPIVLVLLLLLIAVMIFDKKITIEDKKKNITTILITLLSGIFSVFLIFTYLGIIPYFIEVLEFLKSFTSGNLSLIDNITLTVFKRLGIGLFFNDIFEILKSLFLGKSGIYHFYSSILPLIKGNLILIALLLSFIYSIVSLLYFIRYNNINWYIVITFIYAIFHIYIQKKGYLYHMSPLIIVVFSFVSFVNFNENKSVREHYLYSANIFIFTILLLKIVFSTITVTFNTEHEKIFGFMQIIKNYNFQSIQSLEAGIAGIEIVERLNLKNKYPLFYNFVLNYKKSERINQYKKNILEDVNNGNIDILIFSNYASAMYTNKSILYELEKSIKTNYDSIQNINYYGQYSVIYKSKKLQKIKE